MKKVGIFAGTFDPIHNGHLDFAEKALAQGDLDKIYFLPEPRPRRKQGVRALEHRQGMIEVAIKNHPHLGLIKLEQARFTPHETLPVLRGRFANKQIVLLFGDDVIQHIAQWPSIEELVDSVELLIAVRKTNTQSVHERMMHLAEVKRLRFRYHITESSSPAVASSTIRQHIRSGQGRVDNIPPAVISYIRSHRLYR